MAGVRRTAAQVSEFDIVMVVIAVTVVVIIALLAQSLWG
jgi:hypothetical protein